jgi:rare lipoprotein A
VVRVTNLANERSVIVRVIDRGPHGTSARAQRTIIDVSQSAAQDLDFIRAGRVPVRVEVLEWGDGRS